MAGAVAVRALRPRRRPSAPGTRVSPQRSRVARCAPASRSETRSRRSRRSCSCAVWALSRADRVRVSNAAASSSEERLASPQTSQASDTDNRVSRTRSRRRWSISLLTAGRELGGDPDQHGAVRLARFADDLGRENRVVVRQLDQEAGDGRCRNGVGRDHRLDPAPPGSRSDFDPGHPDAGRSGSPHRVQGGADGGGIQHSGEQESGRLPGTGRLECRRRGRGYPR